MPKHIIDISLSKLCLVLSNLLWCLQMTARFSFPWTNRIDFFLLCNFVCIWFSLFVFFLNSAILIGIELCLTTLFLFSFFMIFCTTCAYFLPVWYLEKVYIKLVSIIFQTVSQTGLENLLYKPRMSLVISSPLCLGCRDCRCALFCLV